MKNVLHVINRIDEIEYYKDKKKNKKIIKIWKTFYVDNHFWGII